MPSHRRLPSSATGGRRLDHGAGLKSEFTGKVRGGNKAGAEAIGKIIAERLKEKGITRVVFDRGGNLYHGRVRAVAEAARAAGLDF